MVCIGIPVCRPLYKRWIDKLLTSCSKSASGASSCWKQQKQQGADGSNKPAGPVYGLRTFGGSTMPGASQFRPETTEGETSSDAAGLDGGHKGGGGGHRWLPRAGGNKLHKVGTVGGAVTTSGGAGKDQKAWDDGFSEVRLGINGPFNEATAVGGAGWNDSEEEILGSEFRPGGRRAGSRRRQSDLESGRHGRTGIQVTEEWRIYRPGELDR